MESRERVLKFCGLSPGQFALASICGQPLFAYHPLVANPNPTSSLCHHHPTISLIISTHDSPTSSPSHLSMFTLFNRLPIEIRLKILEAAQQDPSVINIKEKRLRKIRYGHNIVIVASDAKAPSVLFACRESDSIASKFYILSFTFADLSAEIYFSCMQISSILD
jgi:hypothetical protein